VREKWVLHQKPQLFASTKRIHLRCSRFGSRSPRLLTTHHIPLLSISFSFKYMHMHISHLSRRLFPVQGNAIYKKTDIEIERETASRRGEKRLHLLVCAERVKVQCNKAYALSFQCAHVFQRAHVIYTALEYSKQNLFSFHSNELTERRRE